MRTRYCARAAKRLCGKIGGGPSAVAALGTADADQWYRACSHAGEHKYPYGETVSAGTCNDMARGVGAPVAVGILQCATASANTRQSVDATKGFRCCS
jgi:hypothetical protein